MDHATNVHNEIMKMETCQESWEIPEIHEHTSILKTITLYGHPRQFMKYLSKNQNNFGKHGWRKQLARCASHH